MGKDFEPIFKLYFPYIEYSIKSFSNISLSKSGLLALMHCITSVESNIQKTKEIINILIEVCVSNDVARPNKTIAINIIGNVALFEGASFSPYLDTVMKLLFSAAQLGFNFGNNIDEDLIEFVKSLRYELIQAFTCIELTFNNVDNNVLTPYIKDLFEFVKSCVIDTKIQNIEILKSILGLLLDLFGMYGGQFKELCDENFTASFIKIIEGYFKNKQMDSEIESNIDLLKSNFTTKI